MAPLISIGATTPICRSPAINVTVSQCPIGASLDQAIAAWVPTVEPQHVGGDCRLVDKYEVGRIKKALLPNPASARARDVGALPLCRPQTFF